MSFKLNTLIIIGSVKNLRTYTNLKNIARMQEKKESDMQKKMAVNVEFLKNRMI